MNEKVCKKMRGYVRILVEQGLVPKDHFKMVYKDFKRRYKLEIKMARFKTTSNKLMERAKTVPLEETHDTNH